MKDRRLTVSEQRTDPSAEPTLRHQHAPPTRLAERHARRPRTHEEVDAAYEASRNEWTAAMRAARSGRPADLAALAIAQETYEAALAEKRRWDASPRVAIPVQPDRPRGIDAIVGQEFARRRVQELDEQGRREKPKGIRGALNRLRGR